MKISQTPLQDCFIIENTVFNDDRGYFFESFNQQKFKNQTGIDVNFVQDNQSKSTFGVLRGIHFQKGEHAQAKLVRVLEGSVIDVAVDLRPNSPTFGKWFTLELTATNNLQLFVPRGFGHGFVVTSPTATFFYKCDNLYNKESEGGILFNDKTLNIDWQIDNQSVILSPKDAILPSFDESKHQF